MQSVSVRAALKADAPFLAQGIFAAFEAHLFPHGEMSLAMPTLSVEERVQVLCVAVDVEPDAAAAGELGAFVWSNFIVAECDGVLAGCMCPYK